MASDSSIEVARIQGRNALLVAVISSTVTCVIGFLTIFFAFPPFQEWVRSLGRDETPQMLSIEQIPQNIFAYADNSPDGGWSALWVIYNEDDLPTYRLDYFLPANQKGYAGLAFQFVEGSNLSTYSAVECVVTFQQLSDVVDLYFKDLANNFNTIRVANNGAGEMVLRYELKNFPNINFNAVTEFGIVISTDFSTGAHQVRIRDVHFLK